MAPHGDEAPASTHDSKSTKPDEEIEAVKHKKAKSPEYANMLALAKKVRSDFPVFGQSESEAAGPRDIRAGRTAWVCTPSALIGMDCLRTI